MKVAISFIATGSYLNYLPKWYQYLEKNFLPGVEKIILVLKDSTWQLNINHHELCAPAEQ